MQKSNTGPLQQKKIPAKNLVKLSVGFDNHPSQRSDCCQYLGPVFPQQINLPLNSADNDQFTQMSFFHRQFVN